MTLSDLRAIAFPQAVLPYLGDPTPRLPPQALGHLRLALDAADRRDWDAALLSAAEAVHQAPVLLPALRLLIRAEGGSRRSKAKARSARANGRRGGRPRKHAGDETTAGRH